MAMLKMKSIRELSEKDLRDRVEQMRTELSKLQTENAKGTLRKETGKIRKARKEVARLLTRLNEVKKGMDNSGLNATELIWDFFSTL